MKNFYLIKKNRMIERFMISFWLKKQGGEFLSLSLRDYFKNAYKIDAGIYSYGWSNPRLNFGGGTIKIGNYCSIASGVIRLGANHPYDKLSMHPYFYNPSLGYNVKDVQRKDLEIGHGVWLGYKTIILPGCDYIGNGAVIGAGSILTHNVAPYSIVAGNPAKTIKMRFNDDSIKKIEDLQWWKRSPDELMEYYNIFGDIDAIYNKEKFIKGNK